MYKYSNNILYFSLKIQSMKQELTVTLKMLFLNNYVIVCDLNK